jgi:predicted 3-demethylubiquinone-9 3-methyltransferase (glyoxalase superfamily)
MAAAGQQKLTTFLAFQKDAEEAVDFYVSLFDDSEVLHTIRARAGEPGWTEGHLQHATFQLAGQQFMCINVPQPGARGGDHAPWDEYLFSPAMAIYVQCGTDEEFDRVYEGLAKGGEILMPVGTYGFSSKFAWVNDRFGVSWRINLSTDSGTRVAR